jgi:hypothetical protein
LFFENLSVLYRSRPWSVGAVRLGPLVFAQADEQGSVSPWG